MIRYRKGISSLSFYQRFWIGIPCCSRSVSSFAVINSSAMSRKVPLTGWVCGSPRPHPHRSSSTSPGPTGWPRWSVRSNRKSFQNGQWNNVWVTSLTGPYTPKIQWFGICVGTHWRPRAPWVPESGERWQGNQGALYPSMYRRQD